MQQHELLEVTQEMSEPSTNLTISGDKRRAGVNMGDEQVIKKVEMVKQESCKRVRKSYVLRRKT